MWFRRVTTTDDSEKALEESVKKLEATEKRTSAVIEVSTALRILREENHFIDKLERSLRRTN